MAQNITLLHINGGKRWALQFTPEAKALTKHLIVFHWRHRGCKQRQTAKAIPKPLLLIDVNNESLSLKHWTIYSENMNEINKITQ